MNAERTSHPSAAQVETLIDFLERKPSLAKGFAKNQSAKQAAHKEWDRITLKLNSMGGGTVKTPKKWIKYWSDKKSAIKKKAAARAAFRSTTGLGIVEGGMPELSNIEERILALMGGESFATGDTHLQIQPFSEPSQESSPSILAPVAQPSGTCTNMRDIDECLFAVPGTSALVDTVIELLIVDDSEQSESDHGTGSHFAKFRESTEEPLESPLSLEVHTERPLSRESTSRKRTESNADPLSDSSPDSKRQRQVQYTTAKKQAEETISHNTDRSICSDKEDMVNVIAECNLYGQLLAQKMKPLDAEDRLMLMNEIDNLVFRHLMNIRKRSKSSRSAHLSATNQAYLDTRQSIVLPGPSYRSNQTQGSQRNTQYSEYEIPMPFRILKTEAEASPQ